MMNEFTFDLQRFAAVRITGIGHEEVEVPAGRTVTSTIRVGSRTHILKLTNKAAAPLHLELENGLPNVARWLGAPGVGGYAELSAGAAGAYVRYQSLDNDGSLMKQTVKSKGYSSVGYASQPTDYEVGNGFLAWNYQGKLDYSTEELDRIEYRERLLTATLTKITDLDFTKKGATTAYYSLGITPEGDGHGGEANDSTKVTVDSVKEDSQDPGLKGTVIYKGGAPYFMAAREAYLKVTANTNAAGSALQVQVMYGNAKGKLAPSPEAWTGTLTLSELKDKDASSYLEKYAALKFAKPKKAKWHLHVTEASLASSFTGLTAGDYVETAATGNEALTLTKGTYHIYHTEKTEGVSAVKVRTFSVIGSVTVKTNSEGAITSLSDLTGKGAQVSLTSDGQTTLYQLKGGSIWKTETVNGKKISHKTAAAAGTNILALPENNWTFAGGTEALDNDESLQVGSDTIAAQTGDITVTASGDTYTIGGIAEGEEFTAKGYTYHRYHSYLYVHKQQEVRQYVIGKAKAGRLTGAQADITGRLWKTAAETSDENAIESIDLTQADALLKRLKKQGQTPETLSFVHDKYLVPGKKKAILATTIQAGNDYDEDYQHFAGGAMVQNDFLAYAAMDANAGQQVKVADGWSVVTGKYGDTITGAAKGEDFISAGAGKNTIKLSGAADTVQIGTEDSYDTITGYASGKDKILVGDGQGRFYTTVKGTDLYITNGQESLASVDGHQHALLKGAAVSTRAVNINCENYYFGGVKVNVDKKTKEVTATNAQSNIFNYKASDTTAHYIGNALTTADDYNDLAVNKPRAKRGGLDTLKVTGTADTAQTAIDLTDTGKYVSIDAVDASGMKAARGVKAAQYGEYKGVNITASNTGLRFTGSKFADTVTCGEGHDYIITGLNQGADKVDGFGVDDVIQINGLNNNTIAKLKKNGELDSDGFLTKDTLTLGTGSLTVSHAAGIRLQVSGNRITASEG